MEVSVSPLFSRHLLRLLFLALWGYPVNVDSSLISILLTDCLMANIVEVKPHYFHSTL
jgi:hypothetical protein